MILSMQYMRALASLFVVFHHSGLKAATYSSNPLGWFHVGEAGVDLFFIISGYIMCKTVDSRNTSFGRFLLARIRRIIPLYWVLTSLALIIFIVLPEKVNSSGGHTNIPLSYLLFPTEDKYLIQNGWTLSYEFFFYFLFAVGLHLTSNKKYLLPVVLILLLVSVGTVIQPKNYLLGFMTNPLLLEFVFGILVFYFFKSRQLTYSTGLLLMAVAGIVLMYVNFYQPGYPRVIAYGVPALLFFVGMLTLEPFFQKNRKSQTLGFFQGVGDSSYSLYLSHPFTLVAASMILAKAGINEYGYLFVLLLAISSVVAGHLCYLLLERNLQKVVKNYLPPPVSNKSNKKPVSGLR